MSTNKASIIKSRAKYVAADTVRQIAALRALFPPGGPRKLSGPRRGINHCSLTLGTGGTRVDVAMATLQAWQRRGWVFVSVDASERRTYVDLTADGRHVLGARKGKTQ